MKLFVVCKTSLEGNKARYRRFRRKSCNADKQAFVFGSTELNKKFDLNMYLINAPTCKTLLYDFGQTIWLHLGQVKLQIFSFDRTETETKFVYHTLAELFSSFVNLYLSGLFLPLD